MHISRRTCAAIPFVVLAAVLSVGYGMTQRQVAHGDAVTQTARFCAVAVGYSAPTANLDGSVALRDSTLGGSTTYV